MFKTIEKYGLLEVRQNDETGRTQLYRSSGAMNVDLTDWKSVVHAAFKLNAWDSELIDLLDTRFDFRPIRKSK